MGTLYPGYGVYRDSNQDFGTNYPLGWLLGPRCIQQQKCLHVFSTSIRSASGLLIAPVIQWCAGLATCIAPLTALLGPPCSIPIARYRTSTMYIDLHQVVAPCYVSETTPHHTASGQNQTMRQTQLFSRHRIRRYRHCQRAACCDDINAAMHLQKL